MEEYKGPYWRDNRAILIILKSLKEVHKILRSIIKEEKAVQLKLVDHYSKYEEDYLSDEAMSEFSEITWKLSELESDLACAADTAILMSGIALESRINMFCFFNIGEVVTDSIETLSTINKLEVAHGYLGLKPFKGTKSYEALNSIKKWRDLYAHGKCTDRPKDGVRKNHLIHPESYPSVKNNIETLIAQIKNYNVVTKHISKISKHIYTSGSLTQNIEIDQWINKISKLDYKHLDI